MKTSPETSVTVYQSTVHNMPQARRSRSHPGGSLQSGIHVSYLSVLPYFIRNAIKTAKFTRAILTNTHFNINHGTKNAAKQFILGA